VPRQMNAVNQCGVECECAQMQALELRLDCRRYQCFVLSSTGTSVL
jgi:hypothetical protein